MVDEHPQNVQTSYWWVYFVEGNFVLVELRLQLVSVHCIDLREIHFLEVENVLVLR